MHMVRQPAYNTTAHQGLMVDRFTPPIPLQVLGERRGTVYNAEELNRKFCHYLFPRQTNQHGCVTLHSYHFYIEEGLPRKRVLLWVYGDRLRAEFENVVLVEYRCRYDWKSARSRTCTLRCFIQRRSRRHNWH